MALLVFVESHSMPVTHLCESQRQVIGLVGTLDRDFDKVISIIGVESTGKTQMYTIGFEGGVLKLIPTNKGV